MNERTYEVINEELVKHDIGIKGNITSSRIARFFNTGCSIIKEQIAIHTIVNKLKKDRSNEIIAN